jgi:SpoVK/Ycf46/Vps4 family AAA+-type ATPase
VLCLLIDEAENLFSKRSDAKDNSSNSDMVGALLKGMSSHQGGIFLIAATNYPGRIDSAFFRRFSIKVHVPMPNELQRMKIIEKIHEKRHSDSTSDLLKSDFKWLAERTENYCSGDLAEIMKRLETEQFNTIERAKYFRQSECLKNVWMPCTKFEEGAEEHNWEELKGKGATILIPPLSRYHMRYALKSVRATVPDQDIIDGINAFAKQYGGLD